MLNNDTKAEILHDAAQACGFNGHTQTTGNTAAEKVMCMLGAHRATPRKMSYLRMDSVDACFYIQGKDACCTFAAKWFDGSKDLDKMAQAGEIIKRMLHEIQQRVDKAEQEENNNG